jgi:hypothetical protein
LLGLVLWNNVSFHKFSFWQFTSVQGVNATASWHVVTLIAAMRSLEAAICILLIPCARLGYESSSNEWAGICSRLCVTTAMIMLALSNNLSRRVLKRIGLEHWLVLLASCVLLILFALMWTWLCSETTWSSAFFVSVPLVFFQVHHPRFPLVLFAIATSFRFATLSQILTQASSYRKPRLRFGRLKSPRLKKSYQTFERVWFNTVLAVKQNAWVKGCFFLVIAFAIFGLLW